MQQRQCLILQGENDWLKQQAMTLFQQADPNQRLWLSDYPDSGAECLAVKQATQYLGRELSLIVFDCRPQCAADALGAIIGTLKAGGVIILLVSEQAAQSLWLQRLLKIAASYAAVLTVKAGEVLPDIQLPLINEATSLPTQPTQEQQDAIESVIHVVTGHRRRPLVISSDRGRGKTALLGMAAAELLKQGKTTILVTAPSKASIKTLLQHAKQQLPEAQEVGNGLLWQHGQINFIAPDALLKDKPDTDLLIVDEAAAIPAQLLEKMLKSYSRIVFATTLHGYEGTGRGFALRFQKILNQQTPDWKAVNLTQPIRWASDDRLEQFSFDALLLNAEAADDALVVATTTQNASFEILTRAQLVADETLLRQVFGLMVLAHYRTRPSDLQMMLDRDDVSIAVLSHQQQIVATAWLVDEPAIEAQLAAQIFDGKRRLKGQLLPQSLLAHAGLADAGNYNYQRIIRIAVHPALQSQGVGSYLLQQLEIHLQGKKDFLGTSFAMQQDVIAFWQRNNFKPVRLGQHQDQVSGSVSVMMLKPLSDKAQQLFDSACQLLSVHWPILLQRQLKRVPAEELTTIATALVNTNGEVSTNTQLQIQSFAYQQRSYESSEVALWYWLTAEMGSSCFNALSQKQQALLIMLVMQQHEMTEVATAMGLSGRAEVIEALRQAVSDCLSAASGLETR
jgi:tRNA(Met) cytidine acetyltransferase